MVLDQGPQFQSSEFRRLLSAAGIEVFDAGVEIHDALGEVERYYAYRRNSFTRVRFDQQQMNKKIAFSFSIKACKDKAVPSGMVSTLLIFEIVSRMPGHLEEQKFSVSG